MKARVLILVACVALFSGLAWAHGGEEHVIGTVSKVSADSITVKAATGKMTTVAVAPESKFIKNKVAATVADLQVGYRVVIHAKEPTEGHLVADTVEFSTVKPAAKPAAASSAAPKS